MFQTHIVLSRGVLDLQWDGALHFRALSVDVHCQLWDEPKTLQTSTVSTPFPVNFRMWQTAAYLIAGEREQIDSVLRLK